MADIVGVSPVCIFPVFCSNFWYPLRWKMFSHSQMHETDSLAYLFVYSDSFGCSCTAFHRGITGGEVQYNPRTKLTVRSKVTSLIRPSTSLGTKHMFVRQAKLLEPGKDNIKRVWKGEHTHKHTQNSQENLKSAILDHCKGANHITGWEGTRNVLS